MMKISIQTVPFNIQFREIVKYSDRLNYSSRQIILRISKANLSTYITDKFIHLKAITETEEYIECSYINWITFLRNL
jgi:hypothetical protein